MQVFSRFVPLDMRLPTAATMLAASFAVSSVFAQISSPAGPVFEDGQAQIVDAFNDSEKWIRQELWVETEFDSDGDGDLDGTSLSLPVVGGRAAFTRATE